MDDEYTTTPLLIMTSEGKKRMNVELLDSGGCPNRETAEEVL